MGVRSSRADADAPRTVMTHRETVLSVVALRLLGPPQKGLGPAQPYLSIFCSKIPVSKINVASTDA